MMLISRKTCPVLVWGMCVLLSVNSVSVSTPENGTNDPATLWTTADSEEETTAATWAASHKPAEVNAVTAEVSRMSPTKETEKKTLATIRSSVNTVGLTAARTAVAGAVSMPSVQLSHSSTAATKTNQTAPSFGGTTITEGVKQTEGQHQQPATIVTNGAAPVTTSTPLSTLAVSTQPAAVTELENSSELSTTTSSKSDKPISLHNDSTPLVPTASTGAINPTSGAAYTYKTRSSPNEVTETHISTDVTHVPQVSSRSGRPLSSSQSAVPSSSPTVFISAEPPSSSTAVSTSPAAIPLDPKKFPNPKAKISPASTATPGHVSKSTPGTKVQTCSDRNTAKHCLIVIACLALLATIFMVSTTVLCTKLSAKKYRDRRSQQGTEMMCISALLPERNYSFRRQHNPVSNGVLVLPRTGDSDEDGGDNLTLSSFLPDNDRYI